MISGAGTAQGTCSWGDSNNDKIFTPWSGKLSPSSPFEGTFTITGGTGKSTASRVEERSSAEP